MTIKDIAVAAGVSASTVSRALANARYVDLETAEHVRTIAAELGYRPNALAQSLVRKKSNALGLIVPEIENPFYSEIISGVERAASQKGYSVILASGASDSGEPEVKMLLERRVDGIIHGGIYNTNTVIPQLREEGVKVVLLGRKLPGFETDCVVVNDRRAAYQLTDHIIKLGHSHIGYIYGKSKSSGSSEKFAGYRQALETAGLPFDSETVEQGDLAFEGGREAAERLLGKTPRVTAIIAGNDIMALGAREAILAAGLRVPEDIALAGFDDILWASVTGIELTTVAVPRFRMGFLGAELLIKKIEHPSADRIEQIILEPKLVIRRSCGSQR